MIMRLIVKCNTFKRGPLTRVYPELCPLLDNVAAVLQRQFIQDPSILEKECPFEDWKTFRRAIPSCDAHACQLEDLIWKYARKNLAILNIFIKVRNFFFKPKKISKTTLLNFRILTP